MLLMILFWVILVIAALGGGYYYRLQAWFPGIGVVLLLIAILGWKVYPPG